MRRQLVPPGLSIQVKVVLLKDSPRCVNQQLEDMLLRRCDAILVRTVTVGVERPDARLEELWWFEC